MRFRPLRVAGAQLVSLEPIVDPRGSFARSFCRETFAAHGLAPDFVQCNISRNTSRGTLRGLHCQLAPHAEAKLMRCVRGRAQAVALDLRPDTLGRWDSVILDEDSTDALYVPEGCASGFLTLADATEIHYQMSASYAPASARGVRWNDPRFAIEWVEQPRTMSDRDANLPDYEPPPS